MSLWKPVGITALAFLCLSGCGKNLPTNPSGTAGTPTPTPVPTPLPFKSSVPVTDPWALALSPDGAFLFADNFPGSLVDVLGPYGIATTWTGYNGTAFSGVADLSASSDGTVYVLDGGSAPQVDVFSPYGAPVTSWSAYGGVSFNLASGIAVAPNGNVYVGDNGNSEVEEFTSRGGTVTEWGFPSRPALVAVSPVPPYDVYVVENSGHAIYELTAGGNPVTQWGSQAATVGAGMGKFSAIEGIVVGPDGNVFASDGTGPCQGGICDDQLVQEFSPHGTFLTQWGGGGTGPGQFSGSPGGVAFANGDLFVSDPANHRVQVFGP